MVSHCFLCLCLVEDLTSSCAIRTLSTCRDVCAHRHTMAPQPTAYGNGRSHGKSLAVDRHGFLRRKDRQNGRIAAFQTDRTTQELGSIGLRETSACTFWLSFMRWARLTVYRRDRSSTTLTKGAQAVSPSIVGFSRGASSKGSCQSKAPEARPRLVC